MAYNYDTTHDSPNYTPAAQSKAVFGQARTIKGITIHWWGDPSTNPSFAGVRDYLCRANGNTSAHFVATGTGRQVACIVAPGDVAWHAGNAVGNATTIGIECDPRCRDEDYDVIAELVADIRSAYGDVPIYSHNMWTSTTCPGNYDINRIDQMSYQKVSHDQWGQVTDATQKTPATPPAATPTPTATVLYKLVIDGKQVAAYSTDANAFAGYVQYGRKGTISYNGADVTADVLKKYDTPSPTSTPVADGGGAAVTDKPDYSEENNTILKQILSIVQTILSKLTSVFK